MWSGALFDFAIVASIFWFAYRALAVRDIFRAVVTFIVFGFLTAMAWVRLYAPDIALADSIIAAGITGALLLDAYGHFMKHGPTSVRVGQQTASTWLSSVVTVGALGLFGLLARAVLAMDESAVGLSPIIMEKFPTSGVDNPVTAVLLNFRGYDTLLEIGVLVLAIIGVLSLRSASEGDNGPGTIVPPADPILAMMTRVLVPVMVLASGYLLWAGEHAPGGAFQAGSVLGAAGVLLALSGYRRPSWLTPLRVRIGISVGFIVFLGVAVAPMLGGGNLLQYPPHLAKPLMLLIETLLTLSIGVILASLFLSSAAPRDISGGDEA